MTRQIRAPRARVYAALLDADALAKWRVPDGMTCQVHQFEAREGGRIRVSLTYESPDETGKTNSHTDTYRGRFVTIVPDEKVVEVDEFETTEPAFQGEMTITITLSATTEGSELVVTHDGLPRGVAPADNEAGWRMALTKLAEWVENSGQG